MKCGDIDYGRLNQRREAIRLLIEKEERRAGVELDLVNDKPYDGRLEYLFSGYPGFSDFLRVFPDAERFHHSDGVDQYSCDFHGATMVVLVKNEQPVTTD